VSAIQPSAPLAISCKFGLAVSERQRAQIHAVGHQDVEGYVGRAVIPEQEFVELRAPGVVEHDEFAIEHEASGQEIKQLLEPLHVFLELSDQRSSNYRPSGGDSSAMMR